MLYVCVEKRDVRKYCDNIKDKTLQIELFIYFQCSLKEMIDDVCRKNILFAWNTKRITFIENFDLLLKMFIKKSLA